MRYLLALLGFENCPICGVFKGHTPDCPYANR